MQPKPTIPEVAPLLKRYYTFPENGNGGSLHIVTEDRNIHYSHIQWCAEQAKERGDVLGQQIAELMLRMSYTQRRKLAAMYWYPDV